MAETQWIGDWYKAGEGVWLRVYDYREVRKWDTGSWGIDSPYTHPQYASVGEAIAAVERMERLDWLAGVNHNMEPEIRCSQCLRTVRDCQADGGHDSL